MNDDHGLIGPYVLDALDDTDRHRFERHLTGCAVCREELGGLRATAARLGAAAAVRPPAALRDRVMAETAVTRQLPPRILTRPRLRRWTPPALLAAAALIAVALFAGVSGVGRGPESPARSGIDTVLAAPDARTVTGGLDTGGTATVVVSRSLDRAVVMTSGLPDAPHRHAYELWLMGPGDPRPAGLLHDPSGSHLMPALTDATHLGLTIEPDTGSAAPTTPPLLVLRLPA
ncbi:anti-sigma factor [Actinocorallia aurea]